MSKRQAKLLSVPTLGGKMKKRFTKCFFKTLRFILRILTPAYKVCPSSNIDSPAVYLINHQNTRGPLLNVLWFNKPVRMWVLSVFCNHKTCFRQYYDYTFTKRFGIPKFIAAIFVFPLSFIVSAIMQGMEAIPVYRRSREILKTFSESIKTLINKQSIILSPTVDYTNSISNMGEMYKGFLDLEKYYIRETGRHLPFVPLHISNDKRTIFVGEPIYFGSEEGYKQEKEKAFIKLKKEFSRLETI